MMEDTHILASISVVLDAQMAWKTEDFDANADCHESGASRPYRSGQLAQIEEPRNTGDLAIPRLWAKLPQGGVKGPLSHGGCAGLAGGAQGRNELSEIGQTGQDVHQAAFHRDEVCLGAFEVLAEGPTAHPTSGVTGKGLSFRPVRANGRGLMTHVT